MDVINFFKTYLRYQLTSHWQNLQSLVNRTNPKADYPDEPRLKVEASVYYSFGDYSKAEEYFQKALEITRNRVGENHADYSNGLTAVGMIYYRLVSYSKGRGVFSKGVGDYS